MLCLRIVLGQDSIQLSPKIDQRLAALRLLLRGAHGHDLPHRRRNLADQRFEGVVVFTRVCQTQPNRTSLIGVLVYIRPAFIGQCERTSPTFLVCADESFVLELLEGRIDGAWTGLPSTAAAFGNLLDDLVAVHRALRQYREDCGSDVTPAGLGRTPTSPAEPGRTKWRLSAKHPPTSELALLALATVPARHHCEPVVSSPTTIANTFECPLQPRCPGRLGRVRSTHHDHLFMSRYVNDISRPIVNPVPNGAGSGRRY